MVEEKGFSFPGLFQGIFEQPPKSKEEAEKKLRKALPSVAKDALPKLVGHLASCKICQNIVQQHERIGVK